MHKEGGGEEGGTGRAAGGEAGGLGEKGVQLLG